MKTRIPWYILFVILGIVGCKNEPKEQTNPVEVVTEVEVSDPLPSWNDGASKQAIIDFVENAIDENSSQFIPVEARIATFDNDGTLWSEQPAYFQLFFAIDRVKSMAPDHPEWKTKQPFKGLLENDMKSALAGGMKSIGELVMTTHAGLTVEEFDKVVKQWGATAVHPVTKKPFTQMVYQPMLELLDYLRANDFKTYIVSGGGVDFMRALVSEVYHIPSEQIIGSRITTEYDYNNGAPVIKRTAGLDYNDDKEGKPLNIQKIIGKKPVFAAGNSDGDLAMLQWTASNSYKSFPLYVHHTDADREWAYDRESHIGQFDKGLDQATNDGWTVVDMKNDWKVIYPFELKN